MNKESSEPQIGSTIRMLGEILGQIIIDQEGTELFDLVERIRSLSKAWRSGDESANRELGVIMKDLAGDLNRASTVVKAFATYFRLVNLAEEHLRVNILNKRENEAFESGSPMDESVSDAVSTLRSEGLSQEEIQALLSRLDVTPVFTAHPTESRRKTIRQILKRISSILKKLQSTGTYDFQRQQLVQRLTSCIVLLWQSDETRTRRPTVMDEVRNTGLYFFEETLFDVVPEIYRELGDALEGQSEIPTFLNYGSWIAGDRDGNPLVTVEVTQNALTAQKDLTIERYLDDVFELYELLSVSINRANVDKEFFAQLESEIDGSDETQTAVLNRFSAEPYRQKLILIYRKLQETRESLQQIWSDEPAKDGFISADQFLAELNAIRDSLNLNKGAALARGSLDDLIRRVQVFGFHLATLDVRQHAAKHREAVAEILNRFEITEDYDSLEEAKKVAVLSDLISSKRPLVAKSGFSESTEELLSTFELIADAQNRIGKKSMQTYIISMTESVSNILEVLLLMKNSGLHGRLDIVPLFETVDDLLRAPETMQMLFANEVYVDHLKLRGNRHLVMIGYSDSNKDGGYLRANWMLFTAQRNLAATCKSHGIELTLFHGRGGSLGRGGGPANRAILSQPPESVDGKIRVTEQGEVVSSRYSNSGIARRHLQQLVHAALCSTGKRPVYPKLESWTNIMDEISKFAHQKYRSLVEHPKFIDYFQSATPVELVEYLNIGSRPSRRKASRSIDDLRAIPWVFSWTQCRANISSWFGIGTAATQWCAEGGEKLNQLREMYREWQFFNTVFNNVHLGLGRADMGIAELYSRLAENGSEEIFDIINQEFELTKNVVLQITEHDELLDTEHWLKRSIQVRNPYVDPMNYIQVALLERLRNEPDLSETDRDEIRRLLADSVNGIAAGLQNVG